MAEFLSIVTNAGASLEAQALASGIPVKLTRFVVGDGGGNAVIPSATQQELVREVFSGEVSAVEVYPDQESQIVFLLEIPAEYGGFTVREIGLLTDRGVLYAVSSTAAMEKPVGYSSFAIQFRLSVSSTECVDLNVGTGDGLFLRQDANFSDLKDKTEGRKVLGLKGAALLDVGVEADTVAAGDDKRIINALNKLEGGTVEGAVHIVHTFSVGDNPTGVFADKTKPTLNLGDGDTGFVGAGDGVLDVYTNNRRIYRFSEGLSESFTTSMVHGECQTSAANGFRIVQGSRGAFWRFDDANMYLMFTNVNDQYGVYNSLRPLMASATSGDLSTGHNFNAAGVIKAGSSIIARGNVQAGNGSGRLEPDGNILGGIWGGYLHAYLQNTYAARSYSDDTFVRDIHLAGRTLFIASSGTYFFPSGCVLTGLGDFGSDNGYGAYSAIQKNVNGNWYTIGGP